MTFNKRWLLPIIPILLIFLSCVAQPDVPLVLSKEVPTSTTTTVRPPIVITKQTPTPTSTTITIPVVTPATPPAVLASQPKPLLPFILEPELRNLYAEAYNSYKELFSYEINTLFPVPSSEAVEQFDKVRMNYEVQIWRWPYDGEASYPFYVELKALSKQLSALVDKGLPLRSEAERTKILGVADQAKTAKLTSKAADRFAAAEAALASGNTFHTAAKYRSSISFYKKADILYASATAKAAAEKAKTDLSESGLSRFSPYLRIEADRLIAEDASLYVLADSDSIAQGTSLLGRAAQLYNYSVAWGNECQAAEAKDRALIAKRFAAWDFAETNAADEFGKATSLLAEGESKFQSGDFAQAAAKYRDAGSAFEAAQAAARLAAGNARVAREVAAVKLDHLKAKIEASGFEEDANFKDAKVHLSLADEKLLSSNFESSRLDSLEALNQIAISDNILEGKLSATRAAAKAEADRVASEQARLLAQKQAEIDTLSKEKAKVEEKLAEAERQLSAALKNSTPPGTQNGAKTQASPEPAGQNLGARVAEMETMIKRLEADQEKLERAVADAKAEAARLTAERPVTDDPKVTPSAPEAPAPQALLPQPPAPEPPAPQQPVPQAVPEQPAKPEPPATPAPSQEKEPEKPQTPVVTKDLDALATDAARLGAETDIKEASEKLEWAREHNAGHNYPMPLAAGIAELDAAKRAFLAKDFATASLKARSALATFVSIPEFAELPLYYLVGALPGVNGVDSLSRIAGYAFVYGDALKWPFLYNANKKNLPDPANPDLIKWKQPILIPSIKGETRSGTWDPWKTYPTFDKNPAAKPISPSQISPAPVAQPQPPPQPEALKSTAQAALENSRKAYDVAVLRNARNNYPSLLDTGAKELTLAETAFIAGDYTSAASHANSAGQTLGAIKEFAPLPARYTVRRIPSGTDSLWQIAGYPFIYGNSYKWKTLFDANRNLHKNFSNPDLIQPGDTITIPSLAGEVREGLWDPQKTYPPLR